MQGLAQDARETTTYVNVLEAQSRLFEPKKQENFELRHAAKIFAVFPGVTVNEDSSFSTTPSPKHLSVRSLP
jgi:hypothetical protein